MSFHSRAARPANRLAVALAAAIVAPPAIAAPSPAGEPTRLDAVQVTATRVETPIDEALASVTVIDRAEIAASQPRSTPSASRPAIASRGSPVRASKSRSAKPSTSRSAGSM